MNLDLGILDRDVSEAIVKAADEVAAGDLDSQFVIDIFQTGSGTSTNMNANEVISARANEILSGDRSDTRINPNDHVNAGQSSNDSIPTSIHLAAVARATRGVTARARSPCGASIRAKADQVGHIVKTGRTHLMDAPPILIGQEFGAYATQIEKSAERIRLVLPQVEELALGGTVVGNRTQRA